VGQFGDLKGNAPRLIPAEPLTVTGFNAIIRNRREFQL